jgi:hypothetical protein
VGSPDDAIRGAASPRARAASSEASEQGEDFQRMLTVQEVAERGGDWKCRMGGGQGGVHGILVARGCNVERAVELPKRVDLLSNGEPSPGARTFRHAAAGRTKDARSTSQKSGIDVEESTVGGWQDYLENHSKAVGRLTGSATCARQDRQKSPRGAGDARARRMTIIPTL